MKNMSDHSTSEAKTAFMEDVKPYLDQLLDIAGRDLRFHQARGDLSEGELTAEEVVGETLIRAFEYRKRRPEDLSLRAWLLQMEGLAMIELLHSERLRKEVWALSLEEPVPDLGSRNPDGSLYDWYQPDKKERWEDVLKGSSPVPDESLDWAEEKSFDLLEPADRRLWLLLDRYHLSIREIAYTLGKHIDDAAGVVRKFRERFTSNF